MRHLRKARFALVTAGVATTAIAANACGDSTGPNTGTVNLSLASRPSASTAPLASSSSFRPSITISENGNTLVITRAQLVLREIELVPAAAACVDGATDDCPEVSVGPVLVELPVDGAASGPVAVSMSAEVPAGSYTDVEFDLHKVSTPENAREQAFLDANPSFNDISARIEGTYNGQPFVFTARANSAQRFRFSTPLVVDASTQNVTVNVDLAAWFRNSSGALIDPATANTGGQHESVVANNIQASFKAFSDDNRDGRDDG
jgi:hypothetical protein